MALAAPWRCHSKEDPVVPAQAVAAHSQPRAMVYVVCYTTARNAPRVSLACRFLLQPYSTHTVSHSVSVRRSPEKEITFLGWRDPSWLAWLDLCLLAALLQHCAGAASLPNAADTPSPLGTTEPFWVHTSPMACKHGLHPQPSPDRSYSSTRTMRPHQIRNTKTHPQAKV